MTEPASEYSQFYHDSLTIDDGSLNGLLYINIESKFRLFDTNITANSELHIRKYTSSHQPEGGEVK